MFRVVFFDSGLDYSETYDSLAELADQWTLDLHRIPADPPLLDVLAASGLWDHTAPTDVAAARVDLQHMLITEPARRAHALLGPGELWGVRADESTARRHLYTRGGRRDGIITRADGTIAYGPIWNWTTDVWAHIARHRLPVNPVYDRLTPALGSRQPASSLPPARRQSSRPRTVDVAYPRSAAYSCI